MKLCGALLGAATYILVNSSSSELYHRRFASFTSLCMSALCSTMLRYTTDFKLRTTILCGILAAILVACSLPSVSAQDTEPELPTQLVSETECTRFVTGRPGSGMRRIAVREREVQFCFQECERDSLCQAFSSIDAELDVCPSLLPFPVCRGFLLSLIHISEPTRPY